MPKMRSLMMSEVDQMTTLHDPVTAPGVMRIPYVLGQKFLCELSAEIRTIESRGKLKKVPGTEGEVNQNLYSRYVGDADRSGSKKFALENLKACRRLAELYTKRIYNIASEFCDFPKIDTVNSFGIHKYPAYDGGIGYHRDYNANTNLIAIFSIEGSALFSVSTGRNGSGDVNTYMVRPGDLVLMRANRSGIEETIDLRPFHSVSALGHDRYSIVIRNKDNKGEKQSPSAALLGSGAVLRR